MTFCVILCVIATSHECGQCVVLSTVNPVCINRSLQSGVTDV